MTATDVRAPAKLTLSLRITGVRDDGYHFLDAEMVTLDWHDTLTIDPSSSGLSAEGRFASRLPLDESNLVTRALQHVGRKAGVHISKELPLGGGLGGGSADAAAILRWAGYDDVAGSITLGSDVPFCLVGGRARVSGVGEAVEPLPFEPMDITLIVPPLKVSTPFIYRLWDDAGGPRSEGSNDLEPIACSAFTALARWRDRIREATGVAPSLAGSGATWFVSGHHDLDAALPEALIVRTATCP